MRDANAFAFKRGMPRMSWGARNLYNLWQRTDPSGPKFGDISFSQSQLSLFQQRWRSKAVVRAYHGDYINEKIFKRWYLPSTLPDVRPVRKIGRNDTSTLNAFAQRKNQAQREIRKRTEEDENKKGLAPVGSLMFAEVERRIDIFIFRCCFAHSAYEARRLVIHGDVLLNGKLHQNANTRLAPGDMVSVNPEAIRFLKAQTDTTSNDVSTRSEGEGLVTEFPPEPSGPNQNASPKSTGSEGGPKSSANTSNKQAPQRSTNKDPDLTPFHLPDYASPFIFIPAYIEPSFTTCSAIYVRHPTARPGYSEIPTPFDADGEVIRLAWEWYAKVRPRMRSKTQLARMPENRN